MEYQPINIYDLSILVFTFTEKPPANMKAIAVTEAKVVALLKSITVAPIARPSPCRCVIKFCYIII